VVLPAYELYRARRAHVGAHPKLHFNCNLGLVGDGPWDLAAARELGLGFIGIGARIRAKAPEVPWAGEVWQGGRSFPELLEEACHRK